jgi:heme oxygenase
MADLREATRDAHARLEDLPYFQALAQGTLPIESYVGHLRGLAVLHGVLERALQGAQDDRLQAVWTENLRRLPRLQADLDHFTPQSVLDIAPAHQAASALADQVIRRSIEQPLSLLGCLYVLEGSIGGAKVLAPKFGQAFSLAEGQGLSYFSWEPAAAEARWRTFRLQMDSVVVSKSEGTAIVEAALNTFEGIRDLFLALFPFEAHRLARVVTSLNPEAGDHPVPTDPAQLEAALRAGAKCWAEFPYLAWRFGERGWRYTQSDGAWLATLASQDLAVICAQVDWLGGILASRGMPRLILQRKLELLHEEFQGRLPAPPGTDWNRFQAAADHLAAQRRRRIGDPDRDAICHGFELAVGPDWQARLPRMAELLVCAITDRAHGIDRAVTSLEGWLTDPERFPPGWVGAVREAMREAETRLRA